MRRFTMTETETKTTNKVAFTAEDGTTTELDFGKKGLMKTEGEFTETAINVTFWLVTGAIKKLSFARKIVADGSNALTDTMIYRGLKEFVGNTIAGVYQDKEGTHPEDFELGIEQAITALMSGVIPTREKADKSTKGLSDLIRAYFELRNEAVDAEGNFKFDEESRSFEVIKALILGSDEVTNKNRMDQKAVKARIERFKAERAQAKAEAAGKFAESDAALI